MSNLHFNFVSDSMAEYVECGWCYPPPPPPPPPPHHPVSRSIDGCHTTSKKKKKEIGRNMYQPKEDEDLNQTELLSRLITTKAIKLNMSIIPLRYIQYQRVAHAEREPEGINMKHKSWFLFLCHSSGGLEPLVDPPPPSMGQAALESYQ